MGGPKEEAFHLSIESSIFVKLHSFNFFLPRPIKFNKKKLNLRGGKGQAKNNDKFFWEEKFHAANGKAQAHTKCALHFFLLSLGAGGFREGYFSVFPGSHYVDHPTMLTIPPPFVHFGRPKMVINFFESKNFMQPMGRPKHTLNMPCIFFF